ncbi:hypothetical protein V1477_018926 [Vespula maculifrons]|uniref:Uncharacterized protein n=1 Tax=Vespula maculifrons TaxID=7453 RepID=A0ABD2ASU5_VESMC
MSEADGVDSGAICKRGFIHLQFAEKPEAPEAERHLGSRILEIKRYGGDASQLVKGYKAAAFDSVSSYATNFHHSHLNARGTHALQVNARVNISTIVDHSFFDNLHDLYSLTIKCSGGDTLPLVKRYKAADFGNGPVLSRISTSPNLSPRSTHAPENRVVWWGYFGTREVIKGDGL